MFLKIQNRFLLNKRFLPILTLGDKRQLVITGKGGEGRGLEGREKEGRGERDKIS